MFTNPKNGSNAILLGYNQQIRAMGPPETGGYLNLRPSISEVFPPILRQTHVMIMLVDVD